MFKDDISGYQMPVSNKSAQVIKRALVAAHRAGAISDNDYIMTYAEVVEPGRYPQGFGGGRMRTDILEAWTTTRSWACVVYPTDVVSIPKKRGW